MHRIDTQIEINAPTARVWSILMDFPSYPRWNPFIRSLEGAPIVGTSLVAFIQPPGGKGMTFRPKVITATPQRDFRWKGRFLVPGLFDGEHFFALESKAGNRVLFRQGELFSGVLVPLLRRSLDGPTRQGFIAMNEAMKRQAETK
jgi:hypothetical protein